MSADHGATERPRGGAGGPRTLHLHIGLPKTASTWLQDHVFPRLDHLRVVGTPRGRLFDDPKDRMMEGRVLACALRRSAAVWPAMGDAVMREILGDREAWLRDGRDLLVSDEAMGRAASRPEVLAAHLEAMALAARRWGFERVGVLCLIRRQDHWLASHYAQMSDRNARASQRGFEAMVRRVADPAGARHGFGMLIDHGALRGALAGIVDDLLMLPHEALTASPEAALTTLLARLGTPEGTAARIVAASAGTAANVRSQGDASWRLRPRSLSVPGGRRRLAVPALTPVLGRRGTIRLTRELSGRILAAYAASNRALEDAEPLGLGEFGYLPGEAAAGAGGPDGPGTRG